MRLRIHLPEGTSEWESNVPVFRIGRADTCALRFEGASAKYASWEHAEFRVDAGGTYIVDLNSGNGTYVGGARISQPTRLAVGSVVQVGTKGPKLEVLELSPAVPRAVPVALPAAVQPVTAATQRVPTGKLLIAVAVVAIAVVVFFLERANSGAKPDDNLATAEPSDVDPLKPVPRDPIDSPSQSEPTPPVQTPQPSADHKEQPPGAPKPPPDASQTFAAYRLIVAEDPESHINYPLSGAVAVADHTLLTTAAPTISQAEFVAKGWPLKAMKPSDGQTVGVRELRIHPLFQQADPDDKLFFDAALLYTDEPLEDVAVLASDDELEQLELGRPLSCIVADQTGWVYEQTVAVPDGFGNYLLVRRLTLELDEATTEGERTIHILTNLPAQVKARDAVDEYHGRWGIERVFGELTLSLRGEIDTLAYPGAALLGYAVALLTYNVLSVVKAALRVVHGPKLIDNKISTYYLADEVAGMWRGMEVAVPSERWTQTFGRLDPPGLAQHLISIAGHADLRHYAKHPRAPKKPPPKRLGKKPHVSTARILAKRQE